jgi:hypothetical protein
MYWFLCALFFFGHCGNEADYYIHFGWVLYENSCIIAQSWFRVMILTQSLMRAEDVKLYKQSYAWCNVCLSDGLLATAVLLNGNIRLAGRNEGTGGEG